MSEMKLIMENWNKYLLLEASELKTMGDLKKFFKLTKVKKKGGPIAKTAGKVLAGWLLPGGAEIIGALPDFVQALEDAPDWLSAVKSLASKDDNFKTSDALSRVNVDDEISKIVDDQVELDFLNWVVEKLQDLPDETPLEKIDMTDQLRRYLAATFDSRTVTIAGDK